MKFINHLDFDSLTEFLTNRKHGIFSVNGKLELYSCEKLPANESPSYSPISFSYPSVDPSTVTRQLSDIVTTRRPRASSIDLSPIRRIRPRGGSLGSLDEIGSQTLLSQMREALNQCFPDYDFSAMKYEQFISLSLKECMHTVNNHLAFLKEQDCQFLHKLWKSVNESVELKNCEIFSYEPDMNDDPFSDGILWSFNFFIYNKERGRICYFMCSAKRNEMEVSYDDRTGDEESDEDNSYVGDPEEDDSDSNA